MKKAVILSTYFFGYEKNILEEIESKGFGCQLFPGNPNFTFFSKARKRVDKGIYEKRTKEYIKEILLSVDMCDNLVIIFSPFLTPAAINLFRNKFPNVVITYYAWDSVFNFPNIRCIADACDDAFSFDKNDCEKYGYKFLPLFYPNYQGERYESMYDYSMIFSIYPKKVDNYLRLKKVLPKGLNHFSNIYVSKKMYIYYKIFYKNFRCIRENEISFKTIAREEVYRIFNASKVVIDCPLVGQTGLTMRTFEALSMKKKIITTNKDVKNYEFYNCNNIFIVEDDTVEIPYEFFMTEFDERTLLLDKYSLSSFIDQLIGER